MSADSIAAAGEGRALPSPASVFVSVLNGAVGFAVAKLERKVAEWTDNLDGGADGDDSSGSVAPLVDEGLDALGEGGGAVQGAGAEAVKAGLHGQNPISAALKGAWQSGTPAVKAAIIAAAVAALFLLVLSPVLLVVLLLSLLVISAVQRARAGNT